MAKGKTPPAPPSTPPALTPEEGITRLQDMAKRGTQLLQSAPTDFEVSSYEASLELALVESLGSDSPLTHRTMRAGRAGDIADMNNQDYDPVPSWPKRIRAKNALLGECIAHLERLAARTKPPAPAPSAPSAFSSVERILHRFHKVAMQLRSRRDVRPPLEMNDEYDVQYLLNALLHVSFRDIRAEETGPSVAGGRPRLDFLLKEEQIVIEVKKTRPTLTDKELGDELLVDIGRYKSHEDCKTLVCFIYDPGGHVRNADGLTRDLEKQSSAALKVRVLIVPEH